MTVREMICWWSRVAIVQEMQSNNKIRVPMLNYGRSTGDAGYIIDCPNDDFLRCSCSSIPSQFWSHDDRHPQAAAATTADHGGTDKDWDRHLGMQIYWVRVRSGLSMSNGQPRWKQEFPGVSQGTYDRISVNRSELLTLSWRCIWILFLVDKNNSIYRSY